MPKRPKKQPQNHSWAIYREGEALIFVGFVEAPNEKTAIARAVAEYSVPPDELDRIVVREAGD